MDVIRHMPVCSRVAVGGHGDAGQTSRCGVRADADLGSGEDVRPGDD